MSKKISPCIKSLLRPVKWWLILNIVWPIRKNKLLHTLVMEPLETLKYIEQKNCSFVRFGDGELDIIFGHQGPKFQNNQPELSSKLRYIFNHPKPNLLICVPEALNWKELTKYNRHHEYFWKRFLLINSSNFAQIINPSYHYGCTQITRPYIGLKDRSTSTDIFAYFKKLFSNRKVVIVEGQKTRFGVGNDLLDNALSVQRILGPVRNAFSQIHLICEECVKQPKDVLFLVALGPAAKPLIFELVNLGYQAFDVGHLDIEYECFIRKVDKMIPIPGKWTNEAELSFQDEMINLEKYNSEIISIVED